MAKIKWDQSGDRLYETGVKNGVLYPQVGSAYPKGVAWNGLTAVTETPSGAEANDMYADDMKYGSIRSAETFGGTIEAYTYPDEFMQCDGSAEPVTGVIVGQQTRVPFGLCYRTQIGDDTSNNVGYKLHLVYGATASPSERAYQTINDSPEAITFSWEFESSPVSVNNLKSTSVITIDTTKLTSTSQQAALVSLEEALYGTDGGEGVDPTDPYLPLPNEVIAMLDVSPSGIDLTISAMDADDTISGATVSDLQSGIMLSDVSISGTLHYYDDEPIGWTLGTGNFIALEFDTNADSLSAGIGSDLAPISSNMKGVWKITNAFTEKFKVIAVKDSVTETYEYDLSDLVLETD